MGYLFHVLCLILVWATVGAAYLPVAGRGRIFLVCPATFVGLGAYCYALFATGWRLGMSEGVAFCIGLCFAAIMVAGLALVISRFWYDDLIVSTFAVQMMFTSALVNWRSLTGGSLGVGGFGLAVSGYTALFIPLALCLLLALCHLLYYRRYSPLRMALSVMGEDPVVCASCGIPLGKVRRLALQLSGLIVCFAGGVYAALEGYLTPLSFDLSESVGFLCVVLIAERSASIWACLGGAFLMIGTPEALRGIGLPPGWIGHIQRLIFGSVLLVWALMREGAKKGGGPHGPGLSG